MTKKEYEALADKYENAVLRGRIGTKVLAHRAGLGTVEAQDLKTYIRERAWKRRNSTVTPEPVVKKPLLATPYDEDAKYYFNKDTDSYIFQLPGVPGATVIPGQIVRDIVQAYSSYDGRPATINQCARTFKLSRNFIKKILTALGITHDSLPFTTEHIAASSDDALSEDAAQIRQASLMNRLERERWKEIQQSSDKWNNFEEHTLRALLSALEGRGTESERKIPVYPDRHGEDEPVLVVIGLSDLHYGKYSDPAENGGGSSSREITARELLHCIDTLVRSMSRSFSIDRIVLPIGGDYLHIDNSAGGTTAGTPQDCDGTYAEILAGGLDLLEQCIERLRVVAPVECILMSGNHDRDSGVALMLAIEAMYRNDEAVTMHRSYDPRQYISYGSNCIGFVHGDGATKTNELAGLMAMEASDMWSSCEYKTVYTGHYHTEKTEVDTKFGVTRRQLPSLSGVDRWHHQKGYVDAKKILPAYVHAHKSGLVAILYSTP